jgi:hypothetical protein
MTFGRSSVVWGIFFALRAWLFVFGLNEVLRPDSFEYAKGAAAWSSLLGAGVGSIFGMTGMRLLGVISAGGLGVVLGASSRRWWIPGLVFLSPPGWYTIQASVDAAGALMAVVVWQIAGSRRERLWALPAVAACHSVAALGFGIVAAVDGGRRKRVVAVVLAGGVACLLMVHLQSRYWLAPLSVGVLG